MTWVGRAIRRLEDPALITGQGRFTADVPAAHWVRFVRSPVAAGKLRNIERTGRRHGCHGGRSCRREADHADAAQVQLQAGRRSRSSPTAWCVLSANRSQPLSRRARKKPRTSSIEVELLDRRNGPGGRCARRARRAARRKCMPKRPAMSSSKARSRRRTSMPRWNSAHKIVRVEARSRRQNATPMEPRGGHAAYDAATGRVTLTCTHADAASDTHGHCRRARHAGIRPARDRTRRRRRIRPEDVARRRNMSCWSGWRASSKARSPGPKTAAKI